MTNIPMIAEINVLQHGHSTDFSGCTGKQSACLLSVVAYHHKLVVKLRENRFDTLTETPVSPRRSFPVLLVQPIRDFQSDVSRLEKVLLYVSTQVPLIPKHKAVVIMPFCIIRIMYIMNICHRHIIRMDNSTYPTDSVEFIPIIIRLLGSAEAFRRCALRIVIPHDATLGSCHLADLDGFGIYHENSFPTVYTCGNILTDVFRKVSREFATHVKLSSGYKIRDVFGRFSQPFKEVVLTIIANYFVTSHIANGFPYSW